MLILITEGGSIPLLIVSRMKVPRRYSGGREGGPLFPNAPWVAEVVFALRLLSIHRHTLSIYNPTITISLLNITG